MRSIKEFRSGKSAQEKKLLNGLKEIMGRAYPTIIQMLKQYKGSWTDKLRYRKIKLQKLIEKSRQIIDNANSERGLKNLFKRVEIGTHHVSQMQEMAKFC